MKNSKLIIAVIFAVLLFSAGSIFAQPKKPMPMKPMPMQGMDMPMMPKDGHQALMMAFHHNAMAFTRALWEMSSDGSIQNVDLARAAFAEVKRSLEKMEEVHQIHKSTMGKMDPAMMEKVKPMMEKMEAEKALLKGHIQALESVMQSGTPRAHEVEMHAAAMLLRLEKMNKPEMKMPM
ncbi:MAG: hypothetical protein PSX80_03405 [bacterium]|nr:hypothetical protein [bacterium]